MTEIHRFFIPPENIEKDKVFFDNLQVHQLAKVLRLKLKEKVIVLDNSGWEYEVEITWLGKEKGEGRIKEKRMASGEPKAEINLYQALLKGDKFEWVLQKGTEIGIKGFYPIFTHRCIVDDVSPYKFERWRRIIIEAAEQSRRGKLPYLSEPLIFLEVCPKISGLSLIPWEGERVWGLKESLKEAKMDSPINIFIGPEGGFEDWEIERAKGYGLIPVSLGKRILRSETAGLVVATAILFHFGELG